MVSFITFVYVVFQFFSSELPTGPNTKQFCVDRDILNKQYFIEKNI